MLLTIFNLPAQTRYNDVKALIHSKCGLKDVILDNLSSDSNDTKRVTVGLAEEEDAAVLMRKINGLYVEGQQLYVTTIKKKAPSAVLDIAPTQPQPMLRQPYYQQSNQPSYDQGYSDLQQSRAQAMLVPSMYSGMYGSTQNTTANYGYPQQMQHYQSTPQQLMAQSMLGYDQGAPLGFSNQGSNPSVWSDQNDWNVAGNASAGNQGTQQAKSSSRWENAGDSNSRSRRDAPARGSERDRPSRFGQDAGPRDAGRNAPRRDFGPSRDRGRDAPRDMGRDRDQDRDRNQVRDRDNGRDRGRDAPARDRGRDPPARNAPFREPPARNAPFREPPVRNAGPRDNNRDDLYNRRPEPSRGPTKRQLSPPRTAYSAQGNSAPHARTFSQQRSGPNANQPWAKPQPRQKRSDPTYTPPGKRPRVQAQQFDMPQGNAQANVGQAQLGLKKKKVTDSLEKMKNRTETWRHQIASNVAKEFMTNPKYAADDLPELLLQELKRGIRTRLEDLFGDNLKLTMPEMLQIYKGKFDPNDDTDFFNKAVEDAKINGEKAAEAKKNAALAPDAKKKPVATPVAKPAPVPAPVSTNTTTIPSYPGNKTINKGLKKAHAHLFDNEETLLSQIDENTRKAIDEEVEAMALEVASEYNAIEPKQQFKNYFVRLRPRVVRDFKKMVKVNMAKRLLNIGPIMLRIFTVPKTVSRGKLAPVLAKYGVTSLRKSERRKPPVYYGTCDSYKTHDKLCSMPSITVEGSSVLIKPFQLTGKGDRKKNRKNKGSEIEEDEDSMSGEEEEFDGENDEDGNEYDQNEEEDENENPETNDPEDNKEADLAEDEDTNGNIKMDSGDKQENIDDDNAETGQENEESETKDGTNENSENTGADNTDDASKETPGGETKPNENDFTADVDIKTGTKEDPKGNIIDEIDMADLDDDDLEDW